MSQTTRTFIAIPVPEPLGVKLAGLQAGLSPEVPACRWSASSPFHATLAFLGEVRKGDLKDLCEAVATAVAPLESFEVQLEGLGAFPSPRKPRVIWVGLTSLNPGHLDDLHESVVRAVVRVGYRVDDLRFHPHVTLGRIKSDRHGPSDLTGLLERHRGWSAGSFPVGEVVTFASTLEPRAARYTVLGRAALSGQKTESAP